ncbi:MAG TPA: hypothetical protein VFT57_10510 [Gemmatimonadaceae bacterium]|nr:hypothetical protein [Gemmatimonadaceae bacterium]
MLRSALVLLLLAGGAIFPLCAQSADTSQTSTLAPGARVRLTVDAGGDSALTIRPGRYVGTLRAVGADSVQVQYVGADAPETLPWTVVSRMEVSRGVNTPLKIVAMTVGAVGGGVLGFVVGDGLATEECSDGGDLVVCGEGTSDGIAKFVGTIAGIAGGALLGKVIGGRERWSEAATPRRMSVRPWRGRSGAGIGVVFRVAM